MGALKWLLPVVGLGVAGGFLVGGNLSGALKDYSSSVEHGASPVRREITDAPAETGPGYYVPDTDPGLAADTGPSSSEQTDHGLPTWLFTPDDDEGNDTGYAGHAHGFPQERIYGSRPYPGDQDLAPRDSNPIAAPPRTGAPTAPSSALDDAAERAQAAARAVREAEGLAN
ncbi:hypothetical protein HT136_21290 [Novosphingobium profundi]|uniref:hypothetical protein n=1 Tax=Novosphingobium profundi TaxID=1774954 RepID=UPI001BDA482F|nr:hypothetical protein [Novosphingobium profundi]MBT0670908.1 hypothetical protein [Novosphingobium profundi]